MYLDFGSLKMVENVPHDKTLQDSVPQEFQPLIILDWSIHRLELEMTECLDQEVDILESIVENLFLEVEEPS